MGGDCYAYGLLALGQLDLIAECDMKPWDWGALVPIVQGAGGVMTRWDGSDLRFEGDGTVLAAATLPCTLPRVKRCVPARKACIGLRVEAVLWRIFRHYDMAPSVHPP